MANTASPNFALVQPAPGHGLALEHVPTATDDNPTYVRRPMPSALNKHAMDECSLRLTPLREFAMMEFMNAVTDKNEWYTKVLNDEIVAKWKSEVPQGEFSEAMFDHCIQELRYHASRLEPSGAITVCEGKVVKSDSAIPESTRLALQRALKPLENVPASHKDWHPGSNQQVLDLVHPSLFPLVYGKTRVLAAGSKATTLEDCVLRCGEGAVVPVPELQPKRAIYPWPANDPYNPYSTKFQWLPCEVDISGARSRIVSYINNLHPQKHKDLYGEVEEIIDASIPLWNITLGRLNSGTTDSFKRVEYLKTVFDPEFDDVPAHEGPQRLEGESEWDHGLRRTEWWRDMRLIIQPEPTLPFDRAMFERLNHRTDLRGLYGARGQPLQVIVKLANIELTPENPEYPGGAWHVEGKLNERICATAIYYHSCSNITESSLAFRHLNDEESEVDIDYEQHDHGWLTPIFGVTQDGPKLQHMGAVQSRQGRLVTFPNIVQHRVQPFKLMDPTKPGHRKIVALFLVDPNVRVISTASVPCQRLDWWKEAVVSRRGEPQSALGLLGKLPVEIQDQVFGQVEEFPVSLEEAKVVRLELMEERKAFALDHQREVDERVFSLCEH